MNILEKRWKIPQVYGEKVVAEQSYCLFNNAIHAMKMLKRHIDNNSTIAVHVDVDVDGIGSGYIVNKILEINGIKNKYIVINKGKIHGIQGKHTDYFNNKLRIDLMIIVDSSTNEIDTIKKFNCDVIVIDHHEMQTNVDCGICNDNSHEFVIVNSTVNNKKYNGDRNELISDSCVDSKKIVEYIPTDDMSCGVEVFECMRLMYSMYYDEKILLDTLLYQWSAITLFTDSINTLNERNQWYIQNTVHSVNQEESLKIIGSSISKYITSIDKSYIQYKFAPIINKAIRADMGSEAANIVLNKPHKICDLFRYDKEQQYAIDVITKNTQITDDEFVAIDITNYNISSNYCGVIAARICGDRHKNVIVYREIDGVYAGSFRGRHKDVKYLDYFNENGIHAEGHQPAFGFKTCSNEKLVGVMSKISGIEEENDSHRYYITLGNVIPYYRAENHYERLEDIRKDALLAKIAFGNSNVGAADEINIGVSITDIELVKENDKYFKYLLMKEIECTAFERLAGNTFDLYVEAGNEMRFFLRNIK